MNVFDLAAKISVDTGDFVHGLSDASSKAASTFSKIMSGAGKVAAGAIGVATAGLSAASSVVVGLGKSAVQGYADYEQMIGGIKKLYGESAEQMIAAANFAYEKLGWSSNDYMQTVTTFSASLLKSVGGNTQAASDMAKKAMADMSDNANTFGTDMERIRAAYMGFAKGNFMMLDNLNLGYAGTKKGMKDLIEHANKLRKANGQAANLTIDSFADIIEAINLVQRELKITGTSEHEAATTIAGSYKTMKAAWQNYLNALADEDEYTTLSVTNLQKAIKGYWDQLSPAIERFAQGFTDFIFVMAPYIEEQLPKVIETILPKVIQAAERLMIVLGNTLPRTAKVVLKSGVNAVFDIINKLLGTKIPRIKEIKWPSWSDVEKAAVIAWDSIQIGFRKIAKLVLGDDFNADDSWIQVGSKIFEKIKSGVHGAGELIYRLLNPGADTSEMTPSQLWVGVGKSIWDAVIAGIADIAELIAMFINPDIDFTGLTPDQKWQLIGQTIWEGIKSGIGFIGDLIVGILAPDIDLSQFKADASKWGVIGNAIFTAIGNGTLKVFEFIASLLNPDIDFNSYTANTDKWGAVGDAIWKGILSGVKDIGVFINTLMNPEYDPTGLTAGQVWVDVGEAIIDGISAGVGATTDLISRLILGEGYTNGDPTANWTNVGKKIREWIDSLFATTENGDEGLGAKLWNAIWNGITSGVTGAGDLLYGLLVGGEADASLTSAEKWQQIGTAILDGISLAFNGVTDFIYSLIVGTEVPATNQEKWAGIGTAIIEGIKSAFGTATDLLYGLIVGDGEAANSESKKWEGIGNAILNGIRTAFTSVTDFLYSIIVGGETPATNPDKWSAIGVAILNGIKSAFTTAGDFIYTLIVGDGKAAKTATSAEKWQYVGEAVLGGIRLAASKTTDFLYKLIIGEDAENLTSAEKWEGIGHAVLDGISKAVGAGSNLLLRLILGNDYQSGENGGTPSSWVDAGAKINKWLTELFTTLVENEDGTTETVGAHLFRLLLDGMKSAAEGVGDILLGLLFGGQYKSWSELGAQIWSDLTSSFKVPDWLINLYNKFIDLVNLTGAGLKHWGEGESVSDILAKAENDEQAVRGFINRLQEMYATSGEHAKTTQEWAATVEAIEKIIPGISQYLYDENGKIKINTEEIEKNIAAWKERATLEDMHSGAEDQYNRVMKAYEDQQSAQSRMDKATETIEEYRQKATELAKMIMNMGVNSDNGGFGDYFTFDGNNLGVGEAQNFLRMLVDAGDADVSAFEGLQELLDAASEGEFEEALKNFNLEEFLSAFSVDTIGDVVAELYDAAGTFQQAWGPTGIWGAFQNLYKDGAIQAAIDEFNAAEQALTEATTRYNDAVNNFAAYAVYIQEALGDTQSISDLINGLPDEKTITVTLKTINGSLDANEDGETPESNAKGLNYVPVNDYLTRLHKGEAVLSANQAREWRNGVRGGLDTELIANAVKGAITEAMGNMAFVMNGKQVVNAIGGRMSKSMSGFQRADSAGYGR